MALQSSGGMRREIVKAWLRHCEERSDKAIQSRAWMVARAQRQMDAAGFGLGINGAMMLVALGIMVFGFMLVGRRISRPIRTLTHAMQKLAHRDYKIELAGAERGDEIGEMSRAVAFVGSLRTA